MWKYAIAASLATMFAVSPVLAMEKLDCSDKSMMMVDEMMKKMGEDAMKKDAVAMAMKESEMAMAAKKDGKMDDCAMHLNMAQETMMK